MNPFRSQRNVWATLPEKPTVTLDAKARDKTFFPLCSPPLRFEWKNMNRFDDQLDLVADLQIKGLN
jgi:hypothetical protein